MISNKQPCQALKVEATMDAILDMSTTTTSSSSSSHSIADWSRLPGDILGMILKRLTVADYVRTGFVCTSWHLVAMERLQLPSTPSLWLLIPREHRQPQCLTLDFLIFPEKQLHQIQLPISLEKCNFIGSSHGWLIIQTCDTNELHLWNPLTGSHHCLPPLMSDDHNMHDYPFINKAILMSPYGVGCYTVVIIYGHTQTQRSLAFTRHGDESWTALETPFAGFWDVASHDGLIYAVTGCQGLVTCNITHPSSPVVTCVVSPVQYHPINFRYYLVSSASSGTLLLVRSRRWCCSLMEMEIKVFVLDAGSSRWRKLKSLGDLTLFVSSQSSTSLDNMDASTELGRNCIYYTNKYPPYEVGVLDLVEGKVEICLQTAGTDLCSPFWFLPSLK